MRQRKAIGRRGTDLLQKKELSEWKGKLVYQDTRKLAMELEDFVMNAQEVHDEN